MPSRIQHNPWIGTRHQSSGGLTRGIGHSDSDTGLAEDVDQDRTGNTGQPVAEGRISKQPNNRIADAGRNLGGGGIARQRVTDVVGDLLADHRLHRRIGSHAGDHVSDGRTQRLHQTGVGQPRLHRRGDRDAHRILDSGVGLQRLPHGVQCGAGIAAGQQSGNLPGGIRQC